MRKPSRTMVWLIVISVAFCFLLVTNLLPWLRGDVPWLPGDSGWRWPYELPRWIWVIPSILGVALYLFGALHFLRQQETSTRYPVKIILWAFVGAALLPLLLMTMEGRPLFLLFTRSASTLTGGFQYASNLVTDLGAPLRDWTGFVRDYRKVVPFGGIALSPPGLLVLYNGFERFFSSSPFLAQTFGLLLRPLECQNLYMMTWNDAQFASAWPQLFMPLWTALSVAPLYRLGKAVFSRKTAIVAVLMWPLIPGISIFAPRFNTFYALMALVMLVALWRGLTRNRKRWIFVAGFIMSSGTFMNLSIVPLGLFAGLLIIAYWLKDANRRNKIGSLILNLGIYGLGTASVWIVYSGLTGVSIVDIYRLGLSLHFILDRPYFPWLFMHTYDMFMFVGVPIALLSVLRIFRARTWTAGNIFAIALALALVIMVLSGTARGETGRVWLFFAPFWLLLAVDWMQTLSFPQQRTVFILQALVILSMTAVLRANFTTLTVPESPAVASAAPAFPINAQFVSGTDKLTFVGLSVEPSATQVTLHLHWRVEGYVRGPYVFSIVPVAPDNTERENITWEPGGWKTPSPPTCWPLQQTIVDDVVIPLQKGVDGGSWQFSLSVLDVYSREPMQVVNSDGSTSTQVGIGPVMVPTE